MRMMGEREGERRRRGQKGEDRGKRKKMKMKHLCLMRPLVSSTLVSKAECTAANFRTERRLALEERIDAIGKKPKAIRRKKKGDDDVDVGVPLFSKAYANS